MAVSVVDMLFNNIYGNMLLYMCAHKLPKTLVPKEICFSETFLLMSKYNSVFNHLLFKSIPRRITLIIITINFVAIEFCYRIDFTDRNFSMPLFFTLCSASTTPHNVLWKYHLFMQITFIELLKWQSIQGASWYNQQLKFNFIFFYSEFHVFPFFFFCNPLPLSSPQLITSPFTYPAYASIRLNP